jgi:hypothetical protein
MGRLKAGIVLDNWKLPVFERHLTSAGYSFENKGQFSPDCLTLVVVYTDDTLKLQKVVQAAFDECARVRVQSH